MLDDRGLPPYPPSRDAWSYAPAPVGRRWKWLAVLVAVTSVVVAGALTTLAVVLGGRDSAGLIQDDDLLRVIGDECELMTTTVQSMPVQGPLVEQASTIADQDRAVTRMLERIRDVGPAAIEGDRPTADWLDDWDTLVAAREAYVDRIRSGGRALFSIPVDRSGQQIHHRMEAALLDGGCQVPQELLSPFPEDLGDEV